MAIRPPHTFVSLAAAARSFDPPINVQVLRGALDRLGLVDKDERGRRVVSLQIVEYLKSQRRQSGYLHRRGARLPEILAACANGDTLVTKTGDDHG